MEGKVERIQPWTQTTPEMDALSLSRLCQMEEEIRLDLDDVDTQQMTASTILEENDDLCESILSLCDSAELTITGVKKATPTVEYVDELGTSPDVSLNTCTPSKWAVLDVANCDSVSLNTSGQSAGACDVENSCWSVTDEAGNSTRMESTAEARSWAKTQRPIAKLAASHIKCETSIHASTLSSYDTKTDISTSDNISSNIMSGGSSQYSSFITTSEEQSTTMEGNCMPDLPLKHSPLLVSMNRNRKRNVSVQEGEYTPKRQKSLLLNPKYSSTSFPISPILTSSVAKLHPSLTESSEETPVVLSKFLFLDNYNVNNSTPVLHTEKGRHPLECKSKKTIWSTTTDPSPDTSSREFSGFSSKAVDSVFPTPDTITTEISKVCEEGIVEGNEMPRNNERIKTDQYISKIDLGTIVKNDKDKANAPTESSKQILRITESPSKEDFTGEQHNTTNSKSEGRFRNVDASINYTVIDEDVEVTEDFLGIDAYDELDDLDEQEETTLLNDNDSQVNDSHFEKTMTAVADVKVKKTTDIEKDKTKPIELKAETPKESINNSSVIEVFSHCMLSHKKETTLNLKDKKHECRTVTQKKAPNIDEAADIATESKISITIEYDNNAEEIATNDRVHDCSIVKNEFNTDSQRIEDENKLRNEVRRRWNSHGIPCPDKNLTVATTFRKKSKHNGFQNVSAVLEDEHISCLNLYEDELPEVRRGKQPIRRENSTRYDPSIKDILCKLYRHKDTLNRVKTNTLYELRTELAEKQKIMKERHRLEINHLNWNQEMELRQLQSCYTIPQYVLQRNTMQLEIEHKQQREKLKTHHTREYRMLSERLNAQLNMKTEKYSEHMVLIQACIASLENRNVSDNQSKHGQLLTVLVRKAPSRNNQNHSKVPICLPADIAQAILMEEEIYNHFYSFTDFKT